MGIVIRQIFPLLLKPFANQKGHVCLGDVDGKTYFADELFFEQCIGAEAEREESIPLKEEEVTIEDADEDEL